MKPFAPLLFALSLFAQIAPGQQVSENPNEKEVQLSKSKKQNTAGLLLLITGGTAAIAGFSMANKSEDANSFEDGFNGYMGGKLIGITGLSLAVASIPVFIRAKRNSQRAMTITPGLEKVFIAGIKGPVVYQNAISVKFTIGADLSIR